MKARQILLVIGFALALLFVGLLRNAAFSHSVLTPLSGYATFTYVAITVIVAVLLIRSGVQLNRLGFGIRFRARHLGLALAAVAVLQLGAIALEPLLENLFGAGRDLSRFSEVQGSVAALLATLALSWSFAAFGEEIAFRIVLLRGIWSILGDTKLAGVAAVVLQAVIFGLVHLYQGPAGIVGTGISGLAYGAITVLARGAIWPAALAHGINNTIGLLMIYGGAGA